MRKSKVNLKWRCLDANRQRKADSARVQDTVAARHATANSARFGSVIAGFPFHKSNIGRRH